MPSSAVAKHGLVGLARALCNEWAASGVSVNAIAPGYIQTDATEAVRADTARSDAILDRIPSGRWGAPTMSLPPPCFWHRTQPNTSTARPLAWMAAGWRGDPGCAAGTYSLQAMPIWWSSGQHDDT